MKSILLFTLSAVLSLSCWAEESQSSTDGAAELMQYLLPLTSLTGNFSQAQTDTEGELLSQSSGTFQVTRPGLLRWETQEPFPQLLISNGEKLWLYDPDLEQVIVNQVNEQLDLTPAVIFSGDLDAIRKQFVITSRAEGVFELIPVVESGYVQKLELTFSDQQLHSMSVWDGFGKRTTLVFTDLLIGTSIPVGQFYFVPPEGTDVLIHD